MAEVILKKVEKQYPNLRQFMELTYILKMESLWFL